MTTESALQINDTVVIDAEELWFTASRSSGPGGQHVNKTSSRITLHFDVLHTPSLTDEEREQAMAYLANRLSKDGVLQIHVDDHRSQHANRETAIKRLVQLMQSALEVQKARVPTRASAGQKRRRLTEKRQRAAQKKMRRPPPDE